MPTYINYYFVRWVDLRKGEFHEREVSSGSLNIMKSSEHYQILSSRYARCVSLV